MSTRIFQTIIDIFRGKKTVSEVVSACSDRKKMKKFEKQMNRIIKEKNKAGEKIMLNLGCGSDIRDGWISIDEISKEFLNENLTKDRMKKIVQYNCSLGLPIKENSVDFIYSSHFFEHLTPDGAMKLYKDSYRCLKKGGVFRIVLPDAYRTIKNVINNTIPEQEKQFMTPQRTMFKLEGIDNDIDFLNYAIYQHYQHKYIYTPQKVIEILQFVGFKDVKEVSFSEEYDINSEIRRLGSFYVEGIKE